MASPIQLPSATQSPEDRGRVGFSAFLDKNLGAAGFKASTRDNKQGFVVQSGQFRGQTKDEATATLRNQYAGMGDDQKRQYEARGMGSDLAVKPPTGVQGASGLQTGSVQGASGLSSPVKAPGDIGRDGSKQPMLGMDGRAPTYDALDWSVANRTTGDALKQQERNVAVTGSRNRSQGDALSQQERDISLKPFNADSLAAVRAGQASMAAERSAFAKNPSGSPVEPPRLSGPPSLTSGSSPADSLIMPPKTGKPTVQGDGISLDGASGLTPSPVTPPTGVPMMGAPTAAPTTTPETAAPVVSAVKAPTGGPPPGFGAPVDPNSLITRGFKKNDLKPKPDDEEDSMA